MLQFGDMVILKMKPHTIMRRLISNTEPDILFNCLNNAGVVTFNRPAKFNSLNPPMMTKLLPRLQEWEKSKQMVIFKGAGDQAFSAGGDIKAASNKIMGPTMFCALYNIIYFLEKCKLPCISLINGIALGGALSLTVLGKYSVATEKTVVAMPEATLGLIPDAGGSYFLPRLQFNLGRYLGLTGEKLKGKDVVKAGIATHFVFRECLEEMVQELSCRTSDEGVLSVLDKFSEPLDEFSLAPNIKHINYCFAASSVEEIIKRLENVRNDWSAKTLDTLHTICPASLKMTLRAHQLGRQLDLPEVLRMEYRVAMRAIHNHNFPEGVRALLVDKDKNPQWKPKTLAKVSENYVDNYFKKLPDEQELKFFDEKV